MSWESEDNATPDPEETCENKTEWLALVAPAVTWTFVDVVAVPVTLPLRLPQKVVYVAATPAAFPAKVVTISVKTAVPAVPE